MINNLSSHDVLVNQRLAKFYKNPTSSSRCSRTMVARASLQAEDLRFLTRTNISFLLRCTGISFHCSFLRQASKTASQKASAIGFLLHIYKENYHNQTEENLRKQLNAILKRIQFCGSDIEKAGKLTSLEQIQQ